MKKILVVMLTIVMLVTFTIPASASASSSVWNGGEKLNFNPLNYHTVYNSSNLSSKYGLKFYEDPARIILKGEAELLQLRTIQASLERRGLKLLSANGETLNNFYDKDTLVPSAQEEAKILIAIGMLNNDNYGYMNMDQNATRADIAMIVAVTNQSVLGIPIKRNYSQFTDVTYCWAKDYISTAYKIGVMDGINSSEFYPDNTVTLEQMLGILDREVGYYGIEIQDVCKAMNETFKVTFDLKTPRISSDLTSYTVKANEETTIKINFYPSTTKSFEYKSYNSSICKITSVSQSKDTIKVKGINVGTTYIKVNIVGEPNIVTLIPVSVTSNEVYATGITVDKNAALEVGQTYYLSTIITPYNTTNKAVKYYSNDTNIAVVSSKGVITGKRRGVTIIVAEINGYKSYCIVTVTDKTIPVTGITITNSASVEVNYAFYLETTIFPYNATNKSVYYYSSDTNVAVVNSSGQVTGISEGTVVITAQTYNGLKAYSVVTVTNKTVPATGIVATDKVAVEIGYGVYLSTVVLPNNATNKSVRYYSADTSIATVDSNGKVVGMSKGVTVITAQTHNGYKAYSLITVNDSRVTNPTNNQRSFIYVDGYCESSYYNAFNNESMTFIVDTSLAIDSITLSNDNCYITRNLSSNSNGGWQFTVQSRVLSQNGETLLTVKLSNGEELTVRICIYP
jgi:uncharacterized protein YjdB